MPPRTAPWTEAILAHLSDGRWYRHEEAIRVGMRAVPPGRALQQREKRRLENAPTGTGPQPDRTDDEKIAMGARDLARVAIRGLVKRGRIERNGDLIRTTA